MLLAGCGGGGSTTDATSDPKPEPSSVTDTTRVKFDVKWVARSRAIGVPQSALSMRLTLAKAMPDGSDLNVKVTRHVDPDAYLQKVTSPVDSKVGKFAMKVRFYADTDATGAIVGTGDATVTIKSDGTGIGSVTTDSRIAKVIVADSGRATVGKSRQLRFTAQNATGATIALTPGSANWTLISGPATLTRDGILTPTQTGTVSVRASVDGKSSAVTRIVTDNDPDGPAIVLNFDKLPSMSHFNGTPTTKEARLSNRFLSTYGIRFASGAPYVAVVSLPDNTASSSPNSIAGTTPDGNVSYDPINAIEMTFSDPKDASVRAGTKMFSVTTDRDGRASQTVTVTAYDKDGKLVARKSASDTGNVTITVKNSVPNIYRVVLGGDYNPNDGVAFDDVTFKPVVPVE